MILREQFHKPLEKLLTATAAKTDFRHLVLMDCQYFVEHRLEQPLDNGRPVNIVRRAQYATDRLVEHVQHGMFLFGNVYRRIIFQVHKDRNSLLQVDMHLLDELRRKYDRTRFEIVTLRPELQQVLAMEHREHPLFDPVRHQVDTAVQPPLAADEQHDTVHPVRMLKQLGIVIVPLADKQPVVEQVTGFFVTLAAMKQVRKRIDARGGKCVHFYHFYLFSPSNIG